MKQMLDAFYTRPLIAYLVAALILLSATAGPAGAMLVPAPAGAPVSDTAARAADLGAVRKTLESSTLRQRLLDYGLTHEETDARIEGLSDEQLHRLATSLDSVQAGGDALGAILTLALIAALVVLIIYILEGRIVIR